MEGTVMIICLQLICTSLGKGRLTLVPESEVEVITAVGETLTLICNLSESISQEYSITWKNETHLLGGCAKQKQLDCYKYPTIDSSRIYFGQWKWQSFQLQINNSVVQDSGQYQCLLQDIENETTILFHILQATVVPLSTSDNQPYSYLADIQENYREHGSSHQGIQFQFSLVYFCISFFKNITICNKQ